MSTFDLVYIFAIDKLKLRSSTSQIHGGDVTAVGKNKPPRWEIWAAACSSSNISTSYDSQKQNSTNFLHVPHGIYLVF